MRILVTGSSGLVGAELSEALVRAGHEVVEFDVARSLADGPFEDIGDFALLRDRMRHCDGVIHLAAVSRVAWGEQNPDLCYCVNVAGTRKLIDAAFAQPRQPWVLFASSREVYGDPKVMPITEDAPMAPANHYGRSKAAAERLMDAARRDGLRTATLRLSNVYGTANDHPDRAVPALLWNAMSGEELRVTGTETFFDFVHVDDCVTGFVKVADRLQAGVTDLPPIQLTTGIPTSLATLAAKVLAITASRSALTILPPRSFDVSGFCGTPDRASNVLGWQARIGLDQGLRSLRDILADRGRAPVPAEMRLVPCANWRAFAGDDFATGT